MFEERVKSLTSSCNREDCSISYGVYTSTLIGWAPSYDKYGNQTNRDPNTHSQTARCSTCGKSWYVKQQQGKPDTISELK